MFIQDITSPAASSSSLVLTNISNMHGHMTPHTPARRKAVEPVTTISIFSRSLQETILSVNTNTARLIYSIMRNEMVDRVLFIIRTRTIECASRSQGVQEHQVHVPDEIAQALKPADVVRLDEPANDHANLARKEQAANLTRFKSALQ